MSKPFPIIYFGNDWHAENRTSSHHIAERLSKKHPLLYVDSPGLRAPRASGRDMKKLWKKLGQTASLPRKIGEQLWHMVLPQFPFRRLPFAKVLNREIGARLIQRAARHLGMEQPVIWFTVPHPGTLAGHLGERFSVYYCVDDYSALPTVDKEQIRAVDQQLTEKADLVFVSALTLLDAKEKMNKNLVYSPHGVDVEHFGRAATAELPVAERARDLKHPVIGFFGLLEAWIDLDLLHHLAKSRPSWTFLMVGRVAVDVSRLEKLGNFVFVGPQPYPSLPSWAKAFDVAIYPGGKNEFVRNANPLKIREYLATGKPVVSVYSREVERFAEVVRIAHSNEDFLREIDDALANDTTAAQDTRRAHVAKMSWDARTAEVLARVEEGMAQKR